LDLWKKRTSKQKLLLIIMDCNYGELWIETLKNNPDSTVSI